MKRMILSFFILITIVLMTSCVSMEDLSYDNEYVIEGRSYPVYYIGDYPYYWYNSTWVLIPRYRYVYIRHFDHSRYIHAYRPRPHRYYTPRPNSRYDRPSGGHSNFGAPHTRQPRFGNGGMNNGSHGSFSRGR